jgi:hypothetical protein
MDIREEFKVQLDEAEVITEETIQRIIEGRKSGVSSFALNDEARKRLLDENMIRKEYPIGDKSLFVIVYPSLAEREQAETDASRLKVEVIKLLESELDEFAVNHTSLGKHDGSEIPRFQKNDIV